MEYKPEYMADYYADKEPKEFVVVQEVLVLKQYTVEAKDMVDAIQKIESEDYDCIIDSVDSYGVSDIGRIVSVKVNDHD